ncbi:DUF3180 domain-containing protein [Salinifilum ghardaiensis]
MAPRQHNGMTYTQARHLVLAGAIAAIVVFGLVRVSYGSLPPLPLFAGATLLVVAAVDLGVAFTLGGRIQRREARGPEDALTAARALALAKASSAAGAVMSGVWVGMLGYLVPQASSVAEARSDSGAAVVGLISALLLLGAGLFLERRLRNPDEPQDRDEAESDPEGYRE